MAWYDTGTVNVTNGSTTVVGVGTNFIAGAQVGEGFYGPDNRLYEIQAIVSATSLTLADVYLGTTQTGQGYKIVPTQSLVAALATQVSTLISDFQGVVDEAGSGKFNDGTAASAGITFTLDQDTGIFRPAANQIGFTTAGVQRVLVSSAGVDVTGNVTAGDMFITGPTPTLRLTDDDVADEYTQITNTSGNTFTDSRNGVSDGQFIVRGAGGGVITEHFRANANGVGIFNSNPTAALDVNGDAKISGKVTADDVLISGPTPFLTLLDTDGTNKYTNIQNGNGTTYIDSRNDTLNGPIIFRGVGGVPDEYARFDAAGNFGINQPSPSAALDVVGDAEINGNLTVVSASPVMTITETDANAAYQTTQLGVETGNFLIQTRNSAGTFVSNDYIINKDATGANSQQWRIGNQTALFLNSVGLGIGTTSPSNKLHVSAAQNDGIFLEDSSASSASPSLKSRGKRSDANNSQSFSGKLLLDGHRTDAAVAAGKQLGMVGFGGNHTSGSDANILYSASISGVAEGTFSSATAMPTGLAFYTGSTGRSDTTANVTSGDEAMRIRADGAVLIGTTSFTGTGGITIVPNTSNGATSVIYNRLTTAGGSTVMQFRDGGIAVGSISHNASTTSYNTSSDYRLKENIEPVQGAADIVKAMQPVTYTFKSDGSWHDGFLAHELQELHPRAVVGEKDAMKDEEYEVTPAVYEDIIIPAVEAVAEVPAVYDDEGVLVSEMIPSVEAQPERTEQQLVSEAVMGTRSVPDYQGVDYSKLTPILTAALQEALNKIDALEARLTALESA